MVEDVDVGGTIMVMVEWCAHGGAYNIILIIHILIYLFSSSFIFCQFFINKY